MTAAATERPEPITDPPDVAEMDRRLQKVRAGMAAEGLDASVVHDPDNVFYLTNFANYVHERPFVLVILPEGPMRFVTPLLEAEHVRVRSVGEIDLIHYFEFPAPDGETWADRLSDALGGAERVGVEPTCPLDIAAAVGDRSVRSAAVEEARMVKTDYEIGRVAHAAQVVSDGHLELVSGCRPGELALGLFGAVTGSMTARMIGDMPNANFLASKFTAVVQPPSISHDPHNFTDLFSVLEEGGPHVSVINSRVNGYGAEIERSFFLDSVPAAAGRPFEVMMEARRLAFAMTQPGRNMGAVDQAVRDLFADHGYLDALLHRTGHSFGVTGHEAPFLAIAYDREIQPGMLFSIEPGIYLPGVGGFRHSDTVLVTDDGNVSLTTAPDQLEDVVLAT